MPDVAFNPVPFTEAADMIRNKPAVLREVFDRLIPEIKARAFTIAGVASADVLQEVRNRIADLPEGSDWNKVKKDVLASISPWLVTSDEPEERAKQMAVAQRRAELLVRTHAFQAYQAANWQALTETKDAFPFWRYVTAGDSNVRESHAALNGLVLPADSPFWRDHFPPWDWGCRCDVVALSPADVDQIRAEDAKRNPEDRLVLDPVRLKRLEDSGHIYRGPIQLIDPNDPERKRPMLDKNGSPVVLPAKEWDMNSPAKSGAKNAWSWTPGDLRIPLATLRERYDSKTWHDFIRFADKTEAADGVTLMQWLRGATLKGGGSYERSILPIGPSDWENRTDIPDARGVGQMGQELIRDVGHGPDGVQISAQSAGSNGAEIAAVVQGLKPLFHEEWGEAVASVLAQRLLPILPKGITVHSADGHLLVYSDELVKKIIASDPAFYAQFGKTTREVVEGACRASKNGELMGYGLRELNQAGKATVYLLIEGEVVGGFHTRPGDAILFADARAADYQAYFGKPVEIRINYPKP